MQPLGQRIGEILEERGRAFSLRAFSGRIGIGKDTLKRMIDGDRPISRSELAKIAEGLKLSVERLKQEDTRNLEEELTVLFRSLRDRRRAVTVATELVSVAVGCSERSHAAHRLGKAYFHIGDLEAAHESWMKALQFAERMEEKYGDSKKLYEVLMDLTVTVTEREEYERLTEMVERLKILFADDHERMGILHYSMARMENHRGDQNRVREHLMLSLHRLQQTTFKEKIGSAANNLGYFEYIHKNYEVAKKLYEIAIENFQQNSDSKLHVTKEYVKTLLKLGETEKAIEISEEICKKLRVNGQEKWVAQFYLLLALAKRDVRYLESLFENPKMDEIIF